MQLETAKLNETVFDCKRDDIMACHRNGSINYRHYDDRARSIRSQDLYTMLYLAGSVLKKAMALPIMMVSLLR